MKIEIAEPGRMTQTGSSLLRLIQNNNMPALDLFVRETIQNSLDARRKDAPFVNVQYLTGCFGRSKLNEQLEGITQALDSKYPKDQYEYLAIRDSNTVGLTGEMDYKKVKNNEYGNLLKLIYEICKPQDAEGAGGSWGIGKTVYFRMGIGLVIYYSRLYDENGKQVSRLAASLVENETLPDAVIPVYKGQSKRGIAWWGYKTEENVTQPIVDESYIKSFLEIFGIEPYTDGETGTTVIIPYIDKDKLLSSNQTEYLDSMEQPIHPFWCRSIEDYLRVSVQRWYAPRLNNKYYPFGAYLKVKINKDGLGASGMEPLFKVVQALYTRAYNVGDDDILSDFPEDNIGQAKITVRKYLDEQQAGTIAYVKVSKELLGMCHPDNKPSPYMYINREIRETDVNRPIICFTRKPGMIVAYENVGAWVSGVASCEKDKYIIGVFVLNSDNRFRDCFENNTLEEYIRRSEMADHTSWNDWSEAGFCPHIVSKIQMGVNKYVNNAFQSDEQKNDDKENTGLGKLFGDLLLPPEGFGHTPSAGTKPTTKGGSRNGRFEVDTKRILFKNDEMILPVVLESSSSKQTQEASFKIIIDTDSRKIELDDWEEKMGLVPPFYISKILFETSKIDGQKANKIIQIDEDETNATDGDITVVKEYSSKNTCFGFTVKFERPQNIKSTVTCTVKLCRRDVKPAFVYERGEAIG